MKCLFLFFFGLLFFYKNIFYFLMFFLFFTFCFLFGMTMNFFSGMFFCDEISYFLMFLSILLLLLCFFSSLIEKWSKNNFFSFCSFIGMIFFMLTICFTCLNLFLFYLSFEFIFMIMFMFLLSWGYSPERMQASFYMVFYTIIVSFPFLIFIMFMETNIMSMKFIMTYDYNIYWWMFMFSVFLIKLPVYLVHLWLPKAHVEAPVSGSMLLAGILLKLGGYGILRFTFMCLKKLMLLNGYFVSIGMMSSFISCMLCLRQNDLKAFVAYSSVCHMGFCLAGIFSLSTYGFSGGIFMLIAHGFCSSCLFYLLYVMYERFHSRSMFLIKGMLYLMPFFSFFWFVFCIFNMGVPPSFSFFSEVSIMVSILSMNFFNLIFSGLTLFFAGVYCIFLYTISCHSVSVLQNLSYSVFLREYLNIYGHFFPLLFIPLYMNFFNI